MRRFSLKSLLAFTAFVGFALAAVLNANPAWASAVLSLVLLFLLLSTVLCVVKRGRARHFYAGACIFGWAWLALTYAPPYQDLLNPLAQ